MQAFIIAYAIGCVVLILMMKSRAMSREEQTPVGTVKCPACNYPLSNLATECPDCHGKGIIGYGIASLLLVISTPFLLYAPLPLLFIPGLTILSGAFSIIGKHRDAKIGVVGTIAGFLTLMLFLVGSFFSGPK